LRAKQGDLQGREPASLAVLAAPLDFALGGL
jgi:hypothetical protein